MTTDIWGTLNLEHKSKVYDNVQGRMSQSILKIIMSIYTNHSQHIRKGSSELFRVVSLCSTPIASMTVVVLIYSIPVE